MLELYLSYIVFGVGCGLFMNFVDDCMYEGMILHRYHKFVGSLGFWGKPIGGCVVCTNYWTTFIISLIIFRFNVTQFIFAIGFSHFTIIYLTQDKKPKIKPMKCCCENILNVGCFGNCEMIKISFDTIAGLNYTAVVKSNGVQYELSAVSELDFIMIDSSILNESSISVISIFDKDNEQITFESDGIIYDCIQLSITINS